MRQITYPFADYSFFKTFSNAFPLSINLSYSSSHSSHPIISIFHFLYSSLLSISQLKLFSRQYYLTLCISELHRFYIRHLNLIIYLLSFVKLEFLCLISHASRLLSPIPALHRKIHRLNHSFLPRNHVLSRSVYKLSKPDGSACLTVKSISSNLLLGCLLFFSVFVIHTSAISISLDSPLRYLISPLAFLSLASSYASCNPRTLPFFISRETCPAKSSLPSASNTPHSSNILYIPLKHTDAKIPKHHILTPPLSLAQPQSPSEDMNHLDQLAYSERLVESISNTWLLKPELKGSPSSSHSTGSSIDNSIDEEFVLDNTKFMSFEEWKRHKLSQMSQSNLGTSRNSNNGNAKDRLASSGSPPNRSDSLHRSMANSLTGNYSNVITSGNDSTIGRANRNALNSPSGTDTLNQTNVIGVNSTAQKNNSAPQELVSSESNKVEEGDAKAREMVQVLPSRKNEAGTTCKERFNYASSDCAATVLKANSECKSKSAVLVENKDTYMMNKCSAPNKFIIIELCEDILVDTVVLANFEFFSSNFKKFRVSVSDRYPVLDLQWQELGVFEAQNAREIQAFAVIQPLIWARYLRIEFLTHYGNEYYCPISLVRVHGTTMMEEVKHQNDLSQPEDDVDVEKMPVDEPVSEQIQESTNSVESAFESTTQCINTSSSEMAKDGNCDFSSSVTKMNDNLMEMMSASTTKNEQISATTLSDSTESSVSRDVETSNEAVTPLSSDAQHREYMHTIASPRSRSVLQHMTHPAPTIKSLGVGEGDYDVQAVVNSTLSHLSMNASIFTLENFEQVSISSPIVIQSERSVPRSLFGLSASAEPILSKIFVNNVTYVTVHEMESGNGWEKQQEGYRSGKFMSKEAVLTDGSKDKKARERTAKDFANTTMRTEKVRVKLKGNKSSGCSSGGRGKGRHERATSTITATSSYAYSVDIGKETGSDSLISRLPNSTSTSMSNGGIPTSPTVGPMVATQESFFKTLHKRLQALESNSSLSLEYMEQQWQMMREALGQIRQRQVAGSKSITQRLIEAMNETLIKDFDLRKRVFERLADVAATEVQQKLENEMKILEKRVEGALLERDAKFQELRKELTFIRGLIMGQFCLIGTVLAYWWFEGGDNQKKQKKDSRSRDRRKRRTNRKRKTRSPEEVLFGQE